VTDTFVGAGDQRDLVFVHGSDIASEAGTALAILGGKFGEFCQECPSAPLARA
jgi:hypothetical protein